MVYDPKTYRGIGSSISRRASLAIDFAQKMAEQDKLDEDLRERLLEKVPEEFHEWLKEDILDPLFKFGLNNTNIYFGRYTFKDIADVRSKVAKVAKAWSDVVSIKLDKDHESHRVAVRFHALM